MSATVVGVAGAASSFLLIFLSGFWLSRTGAPYSSITLTIHKLVGLAAGVVVVRTIYRAHQVAPLGLVEIIAVVVTGLLFLGTVAAGALLSTGRPTLAAVSTTHQVAPFLTVLSTAVTLYLLLRPK